MRIGIVGCGNISGIYVENLGAWPGVELVACTDRDETRATRWGLPVERSVDALLARSDVELILNLTTPDSHFEISRAALAAGRHVYVEKPLALNRADGRALVDLAVARGLRLGCAPDTFMGGGLQTGFDAVFHGLIGDIVSGQAFMMCHGHESWHPDPAFYYKAGGGPLFDMGPYYLTALVALLGPIRSVFGSTRRPFPQRVVTSTPKHGELIDVEVETHVVAVLEFAAGPVVELTTSFDVWHHDFPPMTLHGTLGSIRLGDPNAFGDRVEVRLASDSSWKEIPVQFAHSENSRGLGVLDIAQSHAQGREHRASGDLAYHVLDVMQSILESAETGCKVPIHSTVAPVPPMPRSGLVL